MCTVKQGAQFYPTAEIGERVTYTHYEFGEGDEEEEAEEAGEGASDSDEEWGFFRT